MNTEHKISEKHIQDLYLLGTSSDDSLRVTVHLVDELCSFLEDNLLNTKEPSPRDLECLEVTCYRVEILARSLWLVSHKALLYASKLLDTRCQRGESKITKDARSRLTQAKQTFMMSDFLTESFDQFVRQGSASQAEVN